MACKKCENSGVDNCSGCNHFDDLFGYDVDILKKNSSLKSEKSNNTADKIKKAGSSIKDTDIKKAGDTVGDLLKGLKKKPSEQQVAEEEVYQQSSTAKKKKSYTGMIIGIALAVIVIGFILWRANRKK